MVGSAESSRFPSLPGTAIAATVSPSTGGKEGELNGNYIAWTIVAILAIIALLIYIAPHFH